MPSTTNMGMVLPTEGGDDDIWDTLINAALTLNDAHDHTTGKGVKVPSAGLRINADVPWNDAGVYYALTGVKALDFQPQAAANMTSYAGALFVSSADNELYFRTTSGTNVKFTNGAALNVTAFTGGIGGDYSAAGALVSYVDADDAYYFQQQGSPRPWARMRVGDVDIYETAASIVNRIRLQSPAALAASYALTFPAALPGSTQLAQVTSAGVMSLSNTVINDLTMTATKHIILTSTSRYKHGEIKEPVGFNSGVTSGATSFGSAGNWPSAHIPINSSLWIQIPVMVGKRLKAIEVEHFNDVATVTYNVYQSGGAVAYTASGTNPKLLTIDTPTTSLDNGADNVWWLKISTNGTGVVDIYGVAKVTDHV